MSWNLTAAHKKDGRIVCGKCFAYLDADVGKGVISSSFGAILKCCGIEVTSIKIDPYLNSDAGTFSPYEHGKYITSR